MKTHLLPLIGLLGIAVGSAHAGTHVGIGLSFGVPAPVIVHRAPPPRIVERVMAAPGPGYVWLPGRYSWQGQWVWIPGAWVMPPRSDARWVDGVWNPQTQQWIDGHWEIPAGTVPVAPPPPPAVAAPAEPPVATAGDIVVAEPPPAPVVEVRTVAPGPNFIWIDGYWGWERGHRVWYRGHWERPPHGYRTWVQPRWEHRPHGYVFVRGYWR